MLPGSFYVRAFIKTCAETLGLNPDELLEGHKKDVPAEEPEANQVALLRYSEAFESSGGAKQSLDVRQL